MSPRKLVIAIVCDALVAFSGCSHSSPTPGPQPTLAPAQSPTMTPTEQPSAPPAPSSLRVWIDGQPAEQVATEVPTPGISNWRVSRPVSTAPRLRYEVVRSARLGQPNAVSIGIFRINQGKTSPQADYSVYSTDPKAQGYIRPGVEHALAKPGEKIGVQNAQNQPVGGVKLASGQRYLLVLNVKGNQAETAQIEVVTR